MPQLCLSGSMQAKSGLKSEWECSAGGFGLSFSGLTLTQACLGYGSQQPPRAQPATKLPWCKQIPAQQQKPSLANSNMPN